MIKAKAPFRQDSRSRVLDIIRATEPTSRIELVRETSLTPASITHLVRDLLAEGLVREVGQGESTGGKPRTLVRLNHDSMTAIGIQLGAASVGIVATNLAGNIVGRQILRGAKDLDPQVIVMFLAQAVADLIDNLGLDRATIAGIGVAMPGPLDMPGGALRNVAYLKNLSGFAMADELEVATGLPVIVDNDATAAAVGEYWLGTTEGHPAYATVYLATGIGSGLMVNRRPYRGSSSNAGEIGHISIDFRGPECSCGNRGCLELFAAPPVLVEKARLAPASAGLAEVALGNVEDGMSRLGILAARGNAAAMNIIREGAESLACGIVTLVNLFDVDMVVLAGPGFSSCAAFYLEEAQKALDSRTLARGVHTVSVVMSASPRDAAALGAATLALQDKLDRKPSGALKK